MLTTLAGVFEALAHDLREVLRLAYGREASPRAAILDSRSMQATPERGARAGYDGAKRRKGSNDHIAVDTLVYLLAASVSSASDQDREQVAELCDKVQKVTGDTVELAWVDHGAPVRMRGAQPRNTALRPK